MYLIRLAVLLAILQASSPIPGQTANPTTSDRQNVKASPDHHESPSNRTLSIQQRTGPQEVRDSGQKPPTEQKQESVRISELPTVSVAPDWWNRVYVLFTGALVLIGGIGARYALRTLRSIELQTKAIIESQRAKVCIVTHGDYNSTILDPNSPRVEIAVLNRGLATANNFRYEFWIEALPLTFDGFSHEAQHTGPDTTMVIYPNNPGNVLNLPMYEYLAGDRRNMVVRGQRFICFRLQANYEDGFGAIRDASFCYYVSHRGLLQAPRYNWDKKAT